LRETDATDTKTEKKNSAVRGGNSVFSWKIYNLIEKKMCL